MIFQKMTTNYLDEQKLIKKILAGEKRALFCFWQEFKDKIWVYIKPRVKNKNDAEEILQDTFLACLDNLRDFQGRCLLCTYLYSIARHKIIDYYRKKKIKQLVFSQVPGLENLVSEVLSPDEKIVRKELQETIRQAFLKIAPEQAKIIYLKYEKGLTIKEIARKLSLTVKVVESRLFRARLAFIKVFNEEEQNFKNSNQETKRNRLSTAT